jgi:hypothetical protein
VQGNVVVTGTLTVDGLTQFNSNASVNIPGTGSLAIGSTTGAPTQPAVIFNDGTEVATLTLSPGNIMTVGGSNPLFNALGGIVAPTIVGPTASSPSFPFGLTSAGNVAGINSIRDRVENYTNATTDQTINWAGSTYYISGLIQGAGPSFSVNVILPADIGTNPAYRGMQIFKGDILIPSSTRTVTVTIKDSALTQLLTFTLLSQGRWSIWAMLGAPGDANNALGLYYTAQNCTNMVAV